jgi:Peroxiredoxin
MRKLAVSLGISLLTVISTFAQGYQVGDKATDFKLKNTDGSFVSLSNYPDAKGFIVVFTCNHCPYAKAYQDRIIQLDQKYKAKGYPVIAISSNDPQLEPSDSYQEMIVRAKEKGYTFPYLFDETQEVYRRFGAKRTPHVFVLQKQGNELLVKYIGAIDDNFQDASKVTAPYLSNAIDALLAGHEPNPSFTKAIGCSIKDKQYKP